VGKRKGTDIDVAITMPDTTFLFDKLPWEVA
jgi:hypothetical protein